jgi:hypothetical protein
LLVGGLAAATYGFGTLSIDLCNGGDNGPLLIDLDQNWSTNKAHL